MPLTDNQKKYVPVLIAALISIIYLLGDFVLDNPKDSPTPIPSASPSVLASASPAPSPLPSPRPSVSPVPLPSPSASVSPQPQPSPVATTQVLDSFERPEFAIDTQWKQSLTRTLLTGQVTSVVLRSSSPCDFVGKGNFFKLIPYTTTKPSAPSYALGTFYDAMRPLDASNCATAKYLQLDVKASVVLGDAQVNIVNKGIAPVNPTVALVSDFNNWDMVRNYCGGVYCPVESKALQALQILKDHRISPYKGVPADTLDFWKSYVLAFSQGPVYMGWSSASSWMASAPVTARAYAYIIDEPAIGTNFDAVVNSWKPYPWIKPMMTAPLKQRDYRVGSPTYAKLQPWSATVQSDVKIFVPVMEQFCQETWKGSGEFYPCKADYDAAGKEVWLYTSNMAHGNEGGPATGAPDMVLDRSAVEQFGLFLAAVKYDITTELYYNTIQGWAEPTTRDLWKDSYQLGGHGEGLLLMPDTYLALQTDGTYKVVSGQRAFPTMRLKALREASQLVDRLANAGLLTNLKTLMTNTLQWDHDLAKFEALDAQAALLLK